MKKIVKPLLLSVILVLTSCDVISSSISSSVSSSESTSNSISKSESTSTSKETSSTTTSEVNTDSTTTSTTSEENTDSTTTSTTSEENTDSTTTSSIEEPVKYDDCYMVGYGSYLIGDKTQWNENSGIKFDEIREDNADYLEKYSKTVDLKVGDTFLLKVLSSPEARWYNYTDLIVGKVDTYSDNFFKVEGDNNIKTLVEGKYTIYVSVWLNYTASIYIDVNSYVEPVKYDDCYMIGYGSFLTGTKTDWAKESGIKCDLMFDNPSALEKYTCNVTLTKGDVFNFNLMSTPERWIAFDSIDANCTDKKYFKVQGENNIEAIASGEFTVYISIWANYSANIWFTANKITEDITTPDPEVETLSCYMLGYGSYLTGTGDWSDATGVKLSDATHGDDAKAKFSGQVTLKADDVFKFHLKGSTTTEVWYDTASLDNGCSTIMDVNFSNLDNGFKVLLSGTYTVYVTIWNNNSASIWINVDSLEKDEPDPEVETINCYMVGYGSYLTGTGDWSDATGVKLSDATHGDDAKAKYSGQVTLKADDVFLFHLKGSATTDIWYNVTSLDNGCNTIMDVNFSNLDNGFKVLLSGTYTVYVTIWSNDSASIWINVDSLS